MTSPGGSPPSLYAPPPEEYPLSGGGVATCRAAGSDEERSQEGASDERRPQQNSHDANFVAVRRGMSPRPRREINAPEGRSAIFAMLSPVSARRASARR